MESLSILLPTVLLLGTGFSVIFICRLLKISPIVGFLIAGTAFGPYGYGLIRENEITHLLAELGVVFLLFDIGIHFSMKSAWKLRRDLFGLAPLQVFISGLVLGFSLAFIFGVSSDIAILVGLTLALSSTAVVMQVVADLKQSESPVGQSAKAVLVFQDLAAIFLLIFADSIGSGETLPVILISTLVKTALAFAAAVAIGRLALGPFMKSIIRYDDPEMFTVLSLFIVMVTGVTTALMGLSLTLGAFLAGMVLAETPFRVLLQTELRPFRSLLMAFFFITVGMKLDPMAIAQDAGTLLSLTLLLVAAKGALLGALIFVLKRPTHHAIQLTFLLSQGSEFAFVILSMATVASGLGGALTEQLIAAIAISMLLTPLMMQFAYRWSIKVCENLPDTICNYNDANANISSTKKPVFIVGMNEVGKTLARGFRAHNIPYIAVDHDRPRFLSATAAGYIVAFGKTDDIRFWSTLGVNEGSAICIASPRYEVAKELTPIIKKIYPDLPRYVAVANSEDGVRFATMGLKPFHSKGSPPGVEMACVLLKYFGIDDESIDIWVEEEQAAHLDSNKSTPEENIQSHATA